MKNITFDLSNLHLHGTAFYDFLRLRKRHFVDSLGWDIPHNALVEMDQYDNPTAHYSLVLQDGEVIGGARCMPTSAEWGQYSYMLRDAAEGKLGDIPTDVLDRPMVDGTIWECTRLVIDDSVTCAEDRTRCLDLIVDGLAKVARDNGAERMISLSPLALARVLRKLGWDATRIGKPHHNTGDGRRYAMLTMPVRKTLPHATEPAPIVKPAQAPGESVLVAPQAMPSSEVA